MILVLGLAATWLVAVVLGRTAETRDAEQFNAAVNRTLDDITSRLEMYVGMLRGGAGLISARPDTSADEFASYVRRLRTRELYPGIQGIGYTLKIPAEDLAAVESRMQAIWPNFSIWPVDPREMYHTIVYIEPLDARNRAVIGFDMYSDPVRREAMDRAAATGESAASGPVTLIQEIDASVQPGFLIYVPVYDPSRPSETEDQRREALLGFVYSPFRAHDLLEGIFMHGMPNVAFTIYDGLEKHPETLVYQADSAVSRSPRMNTHRTIEVAGRQWTIDFSSTPMLEATSGRGVVPVAWLLGSLLSFLLAGLVYVVRRSDAERQWMLEAERAAREHFEKVGRMKDEFLASLSHELRTPLTAILGWADLLKTGGLEESDVTEGIDVIERNARAQSKLIDELLDMSRIISGRVRLDIQRVAIGELIEAAVSAIEPRAHAREVTLSLDLSAPDAVIAADPGRIQQVLWNLLTNAVKFSKVGGWVRIEQVVVGNELEISVSDNGEGIDPEILPYVFDRFRQADASRTRKHGGMGLGLSIVNGLVELHGGSVAAKSPGKGAGSTFIIRLPLNRELQGQPDTAAGPKSPDALPASFDANLVGLKVLIVEDEADSRQLIGRILRAAGAEVYLAANAAQGLELLSQTPPDLIVSDIGMPEMDGYAFIRRVREMPAERGGAAPAIALTAFARPQDKREAMEAGFQQHVSKPVVASSLLLACVRLTGQAAGSP